MKWSELLCAERIREYSHQSGRDLRSEFEKDYHRIIGSASFRRLQDKTQVFPLDQSDFVRTRLTHSLEVSSFAKSLGQNISRKIARDIGDPEFSAAYQEDVCDILMSAGLLHDIGNPPFGHFGETVIREWFTENMDRIFFRSSEGIEKPLSAWLNDQMREDFRHFEGNTQALRVVTKLHYLVDEHGMNLTKALLATIIKYPVSSLEIDKHSPDICRHKMGYYYADREIFECITKSCGIPAGRRHPLTFVLEAADDIAYRTADIEDAYKKGLISYHGLLEELRTAAEKYEARPDREGAAAIRELAEKLEKKYAKAQSQGRRDPGGYAIQNWVVNVQGRLIGDATDAFGSHYSEIMDGSFSTELLAGTGGEAVADTLGDIAYRYAFRSKPILKIEIAAHRVLSFLLDNFVRAVLYYDTAQGPDVIGDKLIPFISDNYMAIYHHFAQGKSEAERLYLRLLLVTDFICGMTDAYASRLYQEMNGFSLL
ncbi:MAG: deoxyguanosinetriphosphate triphosphohydrolase [Lachnospiraceae bacterium]|nr:deoxyguanosinetriphosphate triphosphohydrolase [Lachnospiraceae bacterium]